MTNNEEVLIENDLGSDEADVNMIQSSIDQKDGSLYTATKIPINSTPEVVSMDWRGERLSRACTCREENLYFSQGRGKTGNPFCMK